MKVSKREVIHVADLARLELNRKQIELFTKQLNTVLEYMEKLKEVEADGTEPTFHALAVHNVFREDEVEPSPNRKESLHNAPEGTEDFFVVPKVI